MQSHFLTNVVVRGAWMLEFVTHAVKKILEPVSALVDAVGVVITVCAHVANLDARNNKFIFKVPCGILDIGARDNIMWTTENDLLRNDRLCLFMYFQQYAKGDAYVGDEALEVILETAYEVSVPENKGN